MDYTVNDIAKMIDHSLLNPTLTSDDMEKGITIALDYNVASVCILPCYLPRCAERLRGSSVKASTTIGFPHGGHTTAVKVAEAQRALDDGGEELDMVVNISKVLRAIWHCQPACFSSTSYVLLHFFFFLEKKFSKNFQKKFRKISKKKFALLFLLPSSLAFRHLICCLRKPFFAVVFLSPPLFYQYSSTEIFVSNFVPKHSNNVNNFKQTIK